ncbi:enhanced level of genomic instability 1 isoform X4 [Osmia lignaria lignaria]|uniref:enhanced level of genomic instability 1 isoform X4 n=1 Tax=Osmia lignaria lignaria TaxID=1437193 RepID=UPI0014791593|nr:ATPase family AAA domain-containing protein 5 isoform X4 [Osmia lignaria]
MKNITRYFMDTVKASDNIPLQSNTAKKKETESRKHFKEKYNCSVVEISNTNSEKNICDTIESNSDINSFKEISIQTSKQSFSTKLSSSTKCKKLQNQHLDYLSLKTNDVLNINSKRQTRSSSLNISNDKKQCVKKSRSRENSSSNIQLNDTKNKKGTNIMNLLNIHSSDGSKSNHEESNAFEILMNRNNSIQYIMPTKLFNENESHVEKSEEQLISSTEKLINEEKKCFKRKISEVEGEKVENIIQNPTKLLKKDDFEDTGVLYQKQPSGNLLDYFSKTPVNLTHTDMADISTIIVKADVHMSQNTTDHDLYTSVSNNAIRPKKKGKSKDLQFSQMDDIDVIESESSNISNNEKERKDQLQNKHRWSLRIKFQTYEDENTLLGNSNDEEFSPKSKAKLNIEDSKKCGTNKGQPNKTMSPKTKTRTRKQLEKTGTSNENKIENVSWTYKYRPKSTEEIVGNENAVIKLREWLVRWKIKFINESDDSENDFYSSDTSYSRTNGNNQVAVLLGPHGSGKTASVYALAEEFGYTVLELNASSKRSGKKLLKELEEATKSYQIKNKERTSAFCNLTSNEILPKKISKNSLILIEDVDIIFEEDEGFISAIYQLASNTKCPIVMTCKDVCLHLNKLAPQQSRIYFQSVVGNKVSVLLELISLAETGYRLPSNYIMELLQSGDLRKAILQLQYLLLSGPPQMLEHAINFKNSLWQNMQYYLYRPAIIVSKKQKKKKAVSSKVINNNRNLLNDVADKLDSITLLTSLMTTEDTALNLCELKIQPSLSVVENTALYSTCNNVCLEIAEWIGNKIMYKDHDYDGIRYQNNITLRKQLNKEINLALSHTVSLLLDHQIIATDYLPFIRTICRAEEYRANRNNKRGNRYFHYLHNLKSSSLLKPNILSAACKIMHDIDMRTN